MPFCFCCLDKRHWKSPVSPFFCGCPGRCFNSCTREWTRAFACCSLPFGSHFSSLLFQRSHHHFPVAKIVCSQERLSSLDQWRSRFNLPLSSLRFYLWLKIKRIDALSLVHPLNDIYFLGSVKIDLITSKSNST